MLPYFVTDLHRNRRHTGTHKPTHETHLHPHTLSGHETCTSSSSNIDNTQLYRLSIVLMPSSHIRRTRSHKDSFHIQERVTWKTVFRRSPAQWSATMTIIRACKRIVLVVECWLELDGEIIIIIMDDVRFDVGRLEFGLVSLVERTARFRHTPSIHKNNRHQFAHSIYLAAPIAMRQTKKTKANTHRWEPKDHEKNPFDEQVITICTEYEPGARVFFFLAFVTYI